jgi:phenylalanyl-tRNA synthetase beta chain
MKVPLEWLKEYVAIQLSPEGLAERLTMAGLEVAGVAKAGADIVLDVEVTPNRADCLSILGIAREVAALTGQAVRRPEAASRRAKTAGRPSGLQPPASLPAPRKDWARDPSSARQAGSLQPVIRIEDRKSCERYIGRLLVGVRLGPSPDWMQRRLLACGLRPINVVVDVTNYVLLECGQPLHAFDFYRLAQGTVLVRRAQPEERITTLDGAARTLASDMLVIADAKRAVAIAGIMGGADSAVSDQTRDVLLESALFDAVSIRRTARKLGLSSESAYRFERGVDPEGIEAASARASALIQELSGGREFAVLDVGAKPAKRTGIILDGKRLAQWLGAPVPDPLIRSSLVRLGCHVAPSGAGGSLHVGVPAFRRDLAQDVDLIEEVARLLGYDRIPPTLPATAAGQAAEPSRYWRVQSLRCLCAGFGLTETISWALVSAQDLARCGVAPEAAARLVNPLSQDHAYLRPSLVPGMLRTLRHNLLRGAEDARIFEVGGVVPAGARAQELRLGLALTGCWLRDWRLRTPCDFWILKGLLQALLGRLCQGRAEFAEAPRPWAAAAECAEIRLGGRALGCAGRIADAVAEALDLKAEIWAAEVSVEAMLELARAPAAIQPPAPFPAVKRDISLLVDEATPYERVERTIREAAGVLAARVELIDRFAKGAAVPPGKYSVTFAIEYRDPSRTLAAEEAEVAHGRVGEAVVERLGAVLR